MYFVLTLITSQKQEFPCGDSVYILEKEICCGGIPYEMVVNNFCCGENIYDKSSQYCCKEEINDINPVSNLEIYN